MRNPLRVPLYQLILLASLGLPIAVFAQVAKGLHFDPIFVSGMVLQSGKPLVISGSSEQGGSFTFTMLGKSQEVISDRQGAWSVTLPPLGSATGLSIRIATATENVTLGDINAGDVWLCAGQSNMQFPNALSEDYATKSSEFLRKHFTANHVRFLNLPAQLNASPQSSPTNSVWFDPADPKHAKDLEGFSSVCTHFAAELYRKKSEPMGFVLGTYGGSSIKGWIPNPLATGTLTSHLCDTATCMNYIKKANVACRATSSDPLNCSSWVYNGIIAPIKKLNFAGVAWYQGETDAMPTHLDPIFYVHEFHAMVDQFRMLWGEGLPILVVQLPSNAAAPSWADMRMVQTSLYNIKENIFVTPSYDIYPKDLVNPISKTILQDASMMHPINKATIGHRIAELAESFYGLGGARPALPVLHTKKDGHGNVSEATLTFFDPSKPGVSVGLVNSVKASEAIIIGMEVYFSAQDAWMPIRGRIKNGNKLALEINAESNPCFGYTDCYPLRNYSKPTKVRYGYGSFIVDHNLKQSDDDLPVLPFTLSLGTD